MKAEDQDRHSYYTQLEHLARQMRELPLPTDSVRSADAPAGLSRPPTAAPTVRILSLFSSLASLSLSLSLVCLCVCLYVDLFLDRIGSLSSMQQLMLVMF